MVRCTLILLFFIMFVPGVIASSIKDLINEQSKISPNISISIKNITKNKIIVSHRNKARMTPASNQKILTTLTGLEFLGPKYKFPTHIYFIDSIDDSGVYNGNIYIDTKGDPTLTTKKIKKAILFFKQKGMKEINGNIVINNNYFEKPFYNKTWKSSWKGLSWAPYISSVAVDNNLYSKDQTLYLTDNPLYLLGVIFKKQIKSHGIKFKGQIKLKNISNLIKFNPKKTKYSIDSKELSELIYIINKQSNNLYAEHIFKKISANYFRKSGSWRDSQKIMRFFLNKKVKIDNSEFNIEDGSGLSKYNSVTTSSIINLLEYATKRDYFNDFYNSLPIAGLDGTLLKRFKLKPLYKNMRAKTGYIKGVSSLSGYFYGKNNDLYIFSIIVNDYNYSIRNFIEKILTKTYYL